MHFKVYLLLFLIRCSDAFNITTILGQHPSFSTFNRYLSQTQLAAEINSRRFITVFAVPNDVVSSLSGKPRNVLRNLLRVHVVLGYYDDKRLRNLRNGSVRMTTLFQMTGRAVAEQGYLKATVLETGNVVIRSATQTWGAVLVKSVATEACNVSVVCISNVIVPMGMDCAVLCSGSDSTSPVEPPAPGPKMSLMPASGPAHNPKIPPMPAPGPVYSPKMFLVPTPGPARSPKMPLVPVPGPAQSPKLPLVPTPGPTHSPKMTLEPVPAPGPRPRPVHSPKIAPPRASPPKVVPSVAPKPPTYHERSPSPFANASEESPSAGQPVAASRESPPKCIDTPSRSPPVPPARPPTTPTGSGGSKTSDDQGDTSDDGGKKVDSGGSNLRIVFGVVTTNVILLSIHFIVNI